MASISGYKIKNKNEFFGHEGESLMQGDLYFKGKLLGRWSQDSWGGPDQFHFPEKELKKLNDAAEEYIQKRLLNTPNHTSLKVYKQMPSLMDASTLMIELLELEELEDDFIKAKKKDKDLVAVAVATHQNNYSHTLYHVTLPQLHKRGKLIEHILENSTIEEDIKRDNIVIYTSFDL